MARVYDKVVSTNLLGPINVSKGYPLDVKTVVETVADLTSGQLLNSSYEGLVVYVVEDKSLYVCFNKPKNNKLNSVEEGWERVSYSTRIVENKLNLTDGTIMFPYQGMMAYVESESALYVLSTKGKENSKNIDNWRKIPALDKVGINVKPEGGSGFMIVGNQDVIIEDYVNVENYIKKDYYYTSKGANSFDPNPVFSEYDSFKLSKEGVDDAYIELFATGTDWIAIHNPVDLGLNINIGEVENVSGELIAREYDSDKRIAKETPICFGVDIKFHEGWSITCGNDSPRLFNEKDYELIDIYRSENSPEVYAYLKDIDVRILTEDDLVAIDDKIDNMANSIMIDLDEDSTGSSDSDDEEPRPLQEVIVQMNNQISRLERVEPVHIDDKEIENLFS